MEERECNKIFQNEHQFLCERAHLVPKTVRVVMTSILTSCPLCPSQWHKYKEEYSLSEGRQVQVIQSSNWIDHC